MADSDKSCDWNHDFGLTGWWARVRVIDWDADHNEKPRESVSNGTQISYRKAGRSEKGKNENKNKKRKHATWNE